MYNVEVESSSVLVVPLSTRCVESDTNTHPSIFDLDKGQERDENLIFYILGDLKHAVYFFYLLR